MRTPDDPLNGCVVVEQALHGYEHGHRLLSSSVQFEPNDQRALLMMSDLSGPRVVEGFFEYLTGYPLPSRKFYAFAKTWYASEMERPGCVWTHTLLVKVDDLASLQNAQAIRRMFLRPTRESARTYLTTLSIQSDFSNFIGLPSEFEEVVFNLYSQTDTPVTIPVGSGTEFEGLAVQIWSQQWPALRMNFSFCTGALSERTLNSRPLDLQFGPKRIVRNFGFRASSDDSERLWIREVLDDISSTSISPFRRFLWCMGGNDLTQRTDVRNLGMVHQSIAANSPKKVFAIIHNSYPKKEQARTLKREILSPKGEFLVRSEDTILRCLVEMPNSDSFDSTEIKIQSRAVSLFHENNSAAVEILRLALSNPGNSFSDQYVLAVAGELETRHIEELIKPEPKVISRLVRLNQEITYSDKFWAAEIPIAEKVEVFRILKRKKSWLVGAVLESLLRTRNYDVAALAPSELDTNQVTTLLDWASKEGFDATTLLRPEWLAYLRTNQSAVIEWFRKIGSIPPHMTVLLAQVLTTESIKMLQTTPFQDSFIEAAIGARQMLEERHEVAAVAFAFASHSKEERSILLALDSFGVLHRAMGQSRLSHRAWQLLEPLLPILEQDPWDSCERLRRSLLFAFQENAWPPTYLWDLLRGDASLFSDVITTAGKYIVSREVFTKIFNLVQAGQLSATRKEAKELRKLVF